MNANAFELAALFIFVLGSIFGPDVRGTSANQTDEISVIDPRPLASAVWALEKRFGWTITYEDPPYEFAADIQEVTSSVRKDYDPSKPKVFIPRGGRFTFPVNDNADTSPPSEVLVALLNSYHASGYPGEFRIISGGKTFHVVPTMSNNARGIPEARRSHLDALVTITERERTVFDMVQTILNTVTASGGHRGGIGTVPLNLLAQTKLRGAANNEMARDVLVRTLAATQRNLSWQLFCDPGVEPSCALNVHAVENSKQ
jgi:hypothetical protein